MRGEERPGEGDKVVGMQLHVYIHRTIEPCACVCGRDMQILYLQAFLRVTACCDLLLSWLHVHISSVAFQPLWF